MANRYSLKATSAVGGVGLGFSVTSTVRRRVFTAEVNGKDVFENKSPIRLPVTVEEAPDDDESRKDLNRNLMTVTLVSFVLLCIAISATMVLAWNLELNGNDVAFHLRAPFTFSFANGTGVWVPNSYIAPTFHVMYVFGALFCVALLYTVYVGMDVFYDSKGTESPMQITGFSELLTIHVHYMRLIFMGIKWALIAVSVFSVLGVQSFIGLCCIFGTLYVAISGNAIPEEIYELTNRENLRSTYDQFMAWLCFCVNYILVLLVLSVVWLLATRDPITDGTEVLYWLLFSFLSLGLVCQGLPFVFRPWFMKMRLEFPPLFNEIIARVWCWSIAAACTGLVAGISMTHHVSQARRTFIVVSA